MKKNSRFKPFRETFTLRNLVIGGSGTAVLTFFVGAAFTLYYYITTPAESIIVTTADFPKSMNFTPDNLTDHVVAYWQKIIDQTESKDVADATLLEGLGSRPVKQEIPISTSTPPSPIFKLKLRGVNLDFFRRLGMDRAANRSLELGVISGRGEGWRFTAFLKDQHFSPVLAGSAPKNEEACSNFEKCANDLTEQILHSVDWRRLLKFYIKLKAPESDRSVVELYQTKPREQLTSNDLVAWGDAFFRLNKFDEALQKYQEALEKDPKSCSANVARGFVYNTRPHGNQLLGDLEKAERDFRTGVSCDEKNEYAHTSLCHVRLQQWVNSTNPQAEMLEEAKQHCEKALAINPQLVRAAVNLGYVLYRQKKYDASLNLFEQVSQRYPTNSVLFLNYGFLEYLEYLRDKGEDTLRKATSNTLQAWNLDQRSDIAAINLGYFYYEQGDNHQAVAFWEKARALVPNDPECLAGLALGIEKLGKRDDALRLLSQAIQIDSHYREPAYLMKKHNWSDLAAKDLAKLLQLIRASS